MAQTHRQTLIQRYALPPAQIEALSLERVAAAVAPIAGSVAERAILHRIVYAAGDPTLAGSVRFHPSLVAAGLAALHAGVTIITDVRMVEVALDRTRAAAPELRHCLRHRRTGGGRGRKRSAAYPGQRLPWS